MGRKLKNKIKDSNDLFRRLLLNPCKVMSKKPEHWLFTDWSLYMSEFKIFTSYEDMKLITSRKIWSTFRWIIGQIRQGEITNWFNLDNIENEIKDYAKQHDLKIKGLKITLNVLKKPDGHIPIKKQL